MRIAASRLRRQKSNSNSHTDSWGSARYRARSGSNQSSPDESRLLKGKAAFEKSTSPTALSRSRDTGPLIAFHVVT